MGLGRRGKRADDDGAWVFNRMGNCYSSRPAYPTALLTFLREIIVQGGLRVLDVGAGTGHLALPLARLGARVVAIEPARAMLRQLELSAAREGLSIETIHATAEDLPFGVESIDLALVADALHFLDAELVGAELSRVLSPRGVLCVIRNEFADTPFMQQVETIMNESAPRRPRDTLKAVAQIGAVAGVTWEPTRVFEDENAMDLDRIEQILRTISFIGPAMNPERFATFSKRIREIPEAPIWARRMTVSIGRRHTRVPRR